MVPGLGRGPGQSHREGNRARLDATLLVAVVALRRYPAMITRDNIRDMALDYAKRARPFHPFRRVSKRFIDDMEYVARRALANALEDRIDRHPSKGVTLQ